jgi:hypothetical protein
MAEWASISRCAGSGQLQRRRRTAQHEPDKLLAGLWEAQTEQRVVEARHKSDPKGDKGEAISMMRTVPIRSAEGMR